MLVSKSESVGVSWSEVIKGVCLQEMGLELMCPCLLLEHLLGPSIGWGLGPHSGPCVVLGHVVCCGQQCGGFDVRKGVFNSLGARKSEIPKVATSESHACRDRRAV